jgi:hypothetical protein
VAQSALGLLTSPLRILSVQTTAMFTIPTDEQFHNAMKELPKFIIEMGVEYDYDKVWDWVCDYCKSEGLDEDQVNILDAIYDLAASHDLCLAVS